MKRSTNLQFVEAVFVDAVKSTDVSIARFLHLPPVKFDFLFQILILF